MKKVLTTCGYCGCGCNFYFEVKNGEILGVTPKNDHPVSQGKLCVKGWQGHSFVRNKDRLKQPLLKQPDGTFLPISWSEAYSFIVEKLTKIKKEFGGDAFGGFASARCTNEEGYLFTKFTRTVMDSANIDHCARL